MEEKSKKGLSFILLNLAEGVLPMVLLAIVVTIVSGILLKNGVTDVEKEKLHAAALGLGEYFAYDVREYGEVVYEDYEDHEYVEMLQVAGIELTLFKEDTRFMTSLKNADGSYNEGTKASAEVWAAVSKGEDYFAENLTIGDKKYLVYYTPIYADEAQKEIWGMAFAGTPMTTLEELNASLKINVIIVSVMCVVIFGIIVFILARRLANTLTVIASHIKMLASGNISQKKHVTSLCTEFGQVGESLDTLQDELTDAIGAIYNTSKSLGEAVETVDRLSGESSDSADQITNVIDQIATTAQTMAENVQDANSAMIKMSQSIENITKNSQMAAEKAERMKANNTEAMKNMRNVSESNERSVDAIANIARQAESCNEAVEHIKNAADTIANIAGQTNLLALNASIEAARAGESGRGFAVVADNIRDLAEQSNKSAGEIAQSVHDVVSRVQDCVDMALSAQKLMEEQKSLVENVAAGMEVLGGEVNEVADGIDAVSGDARILDTEKESVLQSITDLSAISEENAASAEEVSASVIDVATGIEGTKGESSQMKGMADQLSEKISFFS